MIPFSPVFKPSMISSLVSLVTNSSSNALFLAHLPRQLLTSLVVALPYLTLFRELVKHT